MISRPGRGAMNQEDAEGYIRDLYSHLLLRRPNERELAYWATAVMGPLSPIETFRKFTVSQEYRSKRRVKSVFPSGHYHSPMVDPAKTADYYAFSSNTAPSELHGIQISTAAMEHFWDRNADCIKDTPFTELPCGSNRYCYSGGPFPWGDAITLRAMINDRRPTRIVEIGSGYSTACMLDSADHLGMENLRLTCIEPDPNRLRALLRAADWDRVDLLERQIQQMPLDIFRQLESDDFLFVDSTHVLKTGSDVHYLLFSVLPILRKGVVVHFHDCHFPFEYPRKWVFDLNYSWNEVYAIRAFLMYNKRFKIIFWNSMFAQLNRDRVEADCPDYLRNPGGSLWLQVA